MEEQEIQKEESSWIDDCPKSFRSQLLLVICINKTCKIMFFLKEVSNFYWAG